MKGTAPSAATVTVYASPDCSGTPAAEGTPGRLRLAGLQVTVAGPLLDDVPRDRDYRLRERVGVLELVDHARRGDAPPHAKGTQQLLPGWDLTAITCTDRDGGTSTSILTGTAQIDLDELITCTFTNRRSDTTPPALTLRASFAVDATSPAGAVVTYDATASDDLDPSPA